MVPFESSAVKLSQHHLKA